MNYCAPCRRHLNGALSCPGCGAPPSAHVPLPIAEAPLSPGRIRQSRRKPKRRGRILAATVVVLAVGGAGVLALASPQSDGQRDPVGTPAEDHSPVGELPTAATTSAATLAQPSGPTKSARPSASSPRPSTSASTTTGQPTPSASAPKPKPSTSPSPSNPGPSPSASCTHFLFWCT